MKTSVCFVLIFSTVAISALKDDDWNLLSECDRTVIKGVSACMQYFSPIKFVTDIIVGNKDSLCCSHFKHNACIRGVRDAVKIAKSANLCPDSVSDTVISALTDSPINNYMITSCKSFNAQKCVMNSVGDVVNTIQGFFVPQQNKPVIPQVIDNAFNRGRNSNNNNYNNNNYNSGQSSLFGPFREVVTRVTSTENPLINKSIKDLFNGQYIPEASVLKPVRDVINERKETTTQTPIGSLFDGLINSQKSDEPSILDSIGSLFNNNDNKSPSIFESIGDIFKVNGTNDSQTIVKDITDAINRN